MNIQAFAEQYLPVIISTFVIYVAIIGLLRFFGQKQISDLNLQDFVMVILISETAQNAMLKDDTTILGTLLALLTIMITNKLINILFFHFPALRRKIETTPLLIVNNGQMVKENMRKIQLNSDELQELIRENGNLSLKEIKYGIMENDGKFSIIPNPDSETGNQKSANSPTGGTI